MFLFFFFFDYFIANWREFKISINAFETKAIGRTDSVMGCVYRVCKSVCVCVCVCVRERVRVRLFQIFSVSLLILRHTGVSETVVYCVCLTCCFTQTYNNTHTHTHTSICTFSLFVWHFIGVYLSSNSCAVVYITFYVWLEKSFLSTFDTTFTSFSTCLLV